MTKEECAIVTLYTGVAMLEGDDLEYLYRYAEKLMERPVFTHELATLADELKKRAKPDFINLCRWASAQPNTSNTLNALDCISRREAIDDLHGKDPSQIWDTADIEVWINELPSVQPEQSDTSEFWRKRADYYSDMCMNLIGEMGKGVKIKSVKINENGIEFIKEQLSVQPIDLQELEDRFGEYVRFVVNDMLTGEGKRWTR